jgi:cytochrome c biogenesis protein CcmG, thiol:disulfide interchange protein DsbE
MARALKLGGQALAVALVAGLLALLIWKVANQGGGAADELAKGKKPPAPAFQLPRLEGGGTLRLASLRGRVTVLNFWGTWCDPCRAEAPLLVAAHRRWKPQGVEFVGIDVKDFSGDAKRFVRRYGITYPIVRDKEAKTATAYGTFLFPETYVVGRDGRLLERLQGQLKEGELDRAVGRSLRA